MTGKLHQNQAFLRKRYLTEGKTMKQIADECGVSVQTISVQLKNAGIR